MAIKFDILKNINFCGIIEHQCYFGNSDKVN